MKAFLSILLLAKTAFGLLDIAENVCDFGKNNELNCMVRTLQSDGINQGNSGDIEKLNIICSDVFYYESILSQKHLGDLPSLQELKLKYCKIRQIPKGAFEGLENLQKLTINRYEMIRLDQTVLFK